MCANEEFMQVNHCARVNNGLVAAVRQKIRIPIKMGKADLRFF